MPADDAALADDATPFVPAAHPAYPQVPSNSGKVVTNLKLVTLVAANEPLATQLFGFSDALGASGWWAQAAREYGLGALVSSKHLTGPAIDGDIGLDAGTRYVAAAAAAGGITPDEETLFLLYLPPGTNAVDAQGAPLCDIGGSHDFQPTGPALFAFVQRPCPGGPPNALPELDLLTGAASHEIVEAATDPFNDAYTLPAPDPVAPWTGSIWLTYGGEIADLCPGAAAREESYLYQRFWSNAAAATGGDPCVPAPSGPSFFNTSVPKGWYALAAGASLTIPITGWSTAPTADWLVGAVRQHDTTGGLTVAITSPTSATRNGHTFATINNGRTATLTITAPASAISKGWALVDVDSFAVGAGNAAPHTWRTGVYVP
jgi:hypothetical protein